MPATPTLRPQGKMFQMEPVNWKERQRPRSICFQRGGTSGVRSYSGRTFVFLSKEEINMQLLTTAENPDSDLHRRS